MGSRDENAINIIVAKSKSTQSFKYSTVLGSGVIQRDAVMSKGCIMIALWFGTSSLCNHI